MSQSLLIKNFTDNNILERAHVARDVLKGATAFTIDNPQNVAANDYLLIGTLGGSMSNLYQVQSVSDVIVTLTTALKTNVSRNTEVTKLFGNKLKLYTAPYVAGSVPTTSNFSVLSGGLIDIDPDQNATLFTDPNGSDQLWYKYTFYNSTTSSETVLADSTAVRDIRTTNYASLEDIRFEAGMKNAHNIGDDVIDRKRQAAQAEINGALAGKYAIPFAEPVNAVIIDITIRLAAGLLMCEQYGVYDSSGGKSKGAQMRDDARADLMKLQTGASVLTDVAGANTEVSDSGGFNALPNANSNPRMFSTDAIQGYNGRAY